MAGTPALQVTGALEFQRALRRMAADLDDVATPTKAAEKVRDRALELVPRESGALADTIEVGDVAGWSASVIAGSDAVPYAGVIEYGWDARGIDPAHYLAGAAEDRADDAADAYAARIDELVLRVGRDS